MTNSKMLDAIAQLQTTALRSAQDKQHAHNMFWLVAEMGWELMCARGINNVSYEEFQQKQEALFEMGWAMVNNHDLTKATEDPWMKKLYEEVDILNSDVIE